MKHRLVNWPAVVLIFVGMLLSFYSCVTLATSVQPSGSESASQVATVVEHREQLLAEYSQNEALPIEQRAAATVTAARPSPSISEFPARRPRWFAVTRRPRTGSPTTSDPGSSSSPRAGASSRSRSPDRTPGEGASPWQSIPR